MSDAAVVNMLLREVQRLRDAVKLGVLMRQAQKEYFAHRTQGSLAVSKKMEAEFDKAARDALAGEEAQK